MASKSVMERVFAKTHGHCTYCNTPITPLGDWEVDHAVPRAKGGSDDLGNLWPACRCCNRLKKARTVEEFRAFILQRMIDKIDDLLDSSQEAIREVKVVFLSDVK